MKSPRAISHVSTELQYDVSETDCPRRFYCIHSPRKLQILLRDQTLIHRKACRPIRTDPDCYNILHLWFELWSDSLNRNKNIIISRNVSSNCVVNNTNVLLPLWLQMPTFPILLELWVNKKLSSWTRELLSIGNGANGSLIPFTLSVFLPRSSLLSPPPYRCL